MFKPVSEYQTDTGLIVYNLTDIPKCSSCGCYKGHDPQIIDLPKDINEYKGSFERMMRYMGSNYKRTHSHLSEAEMNRARLIIYQEIYE